VRSTINSLVQRTQRCETRPTRRRRPELRRPRPHAGAGQSYAGRGPTPAPAQSYAGRGPRGPRPQARPRRPKLYAGWAAVKMAMAKYWALPP
jgi:hypothetical protein